MDHLPTIATPVVDTWNFFSWTAPAWLTCGLTSQFVFRYLQAALLPLKNISINLSRFYNSYLHLVTKWGNMVLWWGITTSTTTSRAMSNRTSSRQLRAVASGPYWEPLLAVTTGDIDLHRRKLELNRVGMFRPPEKCLNALWVKNNP